MNTFTPSQQQAITARGNVLVIAGAGAGKTSTLVERCLAALLDPAHPVSLDEILMVTFTEAAAAEMKHRIRERLLHAQAGLHADSAKARERLEEQLALLDTAAIGTLHGFCLRLVREHFHELALDPQLLVLPEEQVHLLREETLDAILQAHFAGATPHGAAVQQLIEVQGRGREEVIRALVLKLHTYTQTLADPRGWMAEQLAQYRQANPAAWRAWLLDGFHHWRELWLPELETQPVENQKAHTLARQLRDLDPAADRPAVAAVLAKIVAADGDWPRGTKGKFRGPIENFYDEAAFLHSLTTVNDGHDPLAEDWDWTRGHIETLLTLTREFTTVFAAAKREQAAVDFQDLEQFALQLLWDPAAGRPTLLAEELRGRFKLVFVDEYQDINAAQDQIITALGGEGAAANRFLVGDVKQCIYRFRLSDPRIFQNYRRGWSAEEAAGKVLGLADNFRSRELLLRFINPLFAELMRAGLGGVDYTDAEHLQFGAPDQRGELAAGADATPCVEVHLRLTGNESEAESNGDEPPANSQAPDVAELTQAEQEARIIAQRLRELVTTGHRVWDKDEGAWRAVRYGDMAVLLRALSAKAEVYAREFHRQGVPLQVARGDFYESTEITDLLSLLQLLDNPLQDFPLLTVLRSPLVGLSLDDLASIRLVVRKAPLWTALNRWHQTNNGVAGTEAHDSVVGAEPAIRTDTFTAWQKVDTFLERFARWRRLGRDTSLSQRLETVLAETLYSDWLLTQPRGLQRVANVKRLLTLAQQFDPLQRQGLARFLRFVEAQQEAIVTSEPVVTAGTDAVRLTTIHKSKGLEYPVVVLADLGKRFNLRDLSGRILLDEEYGLCPQVQPPQTGRYYPSLPYWLAKRRQRNEALGEELRLLYVAVTRARDLLLLTGTVSQSAAAKWSAQSSRPCERELVAAGSYLHWLGPWWTRQIGDSEWTAHAEGQTDLFRWRIHGEEVGGAEDVVVSSALATKPDSRGKVLATDGQEISLLHPPHPPSGHPPHESRSSGRESALSEYEKSQSGLTSAATKVQGFKARSSSENALPQGGGEGCGEGDYVNSTSCESPSQQTRSLESLERRIQWQYPHSAATAEPAKRSVTALVRSRVEADEEAFPWAGWTRPSKPSHPPAKARKPASQLSAAEIGIAHHTFLQGVGLGHVGNASSLRAEAESMRATGVLSIEQVAALDFEALSQFWQSEVGQQIVTAAAHVRREIPFTARMTAADLATAGVRLAAELPPDDFVVVQGVADLVVFQPEELWLLDFKTDTLAAERLADKVRFYSPQLRLYALALARIYHRPVTRRWLHFLSLDATEVV